MKLKPTVAQLSSSLVINMSNRRTKILIFGYFILLFIYSSLFKAEKLGVIWPFYIGGEGGGLNFLIRRQTLSQNFRKMLTPKLPFTLQVC